MDWMAIIAELKPVLGGTAAVAVAAVLYLFNQRNQRALEGANTDSNISAIAHWKASAERSDAALAAMTLRADKFAAERMEADRMLARLEGQLSEMSRQLAAQTEKIDAQTKEMFALRSQIRHLEEQINAKP